MAGVTPAAGSVSIDLYEDGICPACQAFEGQFGQQIMKAVDDGKLTVRYHFLNFLDPKSASKDYSTRASAAFQCVGAVPAAEAPKGLFLNFHTTMFTSGTQPAEDGNADLSNADIATIALKTGAPRVSSNLHHLRPEHRSGQDDGSRRRRHPDGARTERSLRNS